MSSYHQSFAAMFVEDRGIFVSYFRQQGEFPFLSCTFDIHGRAQNLICDLQYVVAPPYNKQRITKFVSQLLPLPFNKGPGEGFSQLAMFIINVELKKAGINF